MVKISSKDRELIKLRMEMLRRKAKTDLLALTQYLNPKYRVNWHHKEVADQITDFILAPGGGKMIICLPPQHGKSELASRNTPAFALGNFPHWRIACVSYAADLARSFNRDVQRIMMHEDYRKVFPNTRLSDKRAVNDTKYDTLRNTNEFEVIGYDKSYRSVGIGGGLSGRSVDLGIIDDPIKDRKEAESEVIRNTVWDWYLNVYVPRTHNDSKTIVIMTRWHEDDLVGRILKQEDAHEWKVIKIKAIKENEPDDGIIEDPRKPGEALWPQKHSLEKLKKLEAADDYAFSSLYQQEPSKKGGNKIKDEWFKIQHHTTIPEFGKRDIWVDGAYTEKTKNDPSGFMITQFDEFAQILYVIFATSKRYEMPAALKYISELARLYGIDSRSRIFFEPKASGKSMKQMIFVEDPYLNPVEIDSHLVNEGKESRIQVSAPKTEAGRVVLIEGHWNNNFIAQNTKFPNAKHDEYVDLLGYACDYYFDNPEQEGPYK